MPTTTPALPLRASGVHVSIGLRHSTSRSAYTPPKLVISFLLHLYKSNLPSARSTRYLKKSARRIVSVKFKNTSRIRGSPAKCWRTNVSPPLSVRSSYRWFGFCSCQVRTRALSSSSRNIAGVCHVCHILLGISSL